MLHMYVMDRQVRWEEYLYLVEFSYNNRYHSSLGMSHFQALYGRPCHTALSWDHLEDQVLLSQEMLQDMEQKKFHIRENLVTTQDRQMKYANVHRLDHHFSASERVFLRVRPQKSPSIMGKALSWCHILLDLLRSLRGLVLFLIDQRGHLAYRTFPIFFIFLC